MLTGTQLIQRLNDGRLSPSEFLDIMKEEFAKQKSIIVIAKALNIQDANKTELELIKLEFTQV
jgi:hypothetical protein